jgi:hypothetical protein
VNCTSALHQCTAPVLYTNEFAAIVFSMFVALLNVFDVRMTFINECDAGVAFLTDFDASKTFLKKFDLTHAFLNVFEARLHIHIILHECTALQK